MYNENKNRFLLPAMIIRGGTSEGAYLPKEDPPEGKSQWNSLLPSMMGSPDKKQIDGLGGVQSVTNKVAIIRRSSEEDADVDYAFAWVSIGVNLVSYKGNCGNTSSGAGPFVTEKGLVRTRGGTTPVRIFNTNTDRVIIADVQAEESSAVYDGDFAIADVLSIVAPIKLKFVEPAGALGNGPLPIGDAVDILEVPNFGKVEVLIVDAANLLVFVRARDMGMADLELPKGVNADVDKPALLKAVRGLVTVMAGLIRDYTHSAWETLGTPKMIFVAETANYVTAKGVSTSKENTDLFSRMIPMQKVHPSYAVTGVMRTIAAVVTPGSVVNQVLSEDVDTRSIRIGHPSGILECGVDHEENDVEPVIVDTSGSRIANLLIDGIVHIK